MIVRPLIPLIGAALIVSLTAAITVPPREQRGRAGADCRANESGPAMRVTVTGLRDTRGSLRLELYPANDTDFLAPDRDLIANGRVFRRVVATPPASGTASLCIRAPAAGTYALTVLHDRDRDGRFGFVSDGVGFSNNPRLGRAKPPASAVAIAIGSGVGSTRIVMNYRNGLTFTPLEHRR